MRNAYLIGAVVMQSDFPNNTSCQRSIRVAALIHIRAAIALLMILASIGCARYASEPEISPRSWAPQAVEREWAPPAGSRALAGPVGDYAIRSDRLPKDQNLTLAELIGFALANNPSTRGSWRSAQGAAAAAGIARAPFYPTVSAQSANSYQRSIDLVPHHWGSLKTWQSRNIISLDYDLIDFGRRDAAGAAALDRLFEADLLFNRTVQQVVFEVERSFYADEAAQAGVDAALVTAKLARTDLRAANLRHQHGLATGPELLLATQRDAQAEYDLENARLAVSLAQADLAVALGVRASELSAIQAPNSQPLPRSLGADVDQLIDSAVRDRPDLSAKVSEVRAREADVKLARASLYPTISATTYYGEQGFTYRLSNPSPPTLTQTAMSPEYGAGLTLKWDIFTGFSRVNSIKEAEATQDAARADLEAAEVEVAANVWRAYFTYVTAQRKYDYAQALLTASQSSYNSNFQSYRHGLATIVDLLSAERELAAARFTMIGARADLMISAAAVSFATGAIPPAAAPTP
jgi:outer membrane protein